MTSCQLEQHEPYLPSSNAMEKEFKKLKINKDRMSIKPMVPNDSYVRSNAINIGIGSTKWQCLKKHPMLANAVSWNSSN